MGHEGELQRIRWTVDDYHRMGEVGLLGPEDRVELIDGEIIRMAPIGAPHAFCVSLLNTLLVRAVGDSAFVWIQNPVILSRHDEPQPDLLLLRPPQRRYPQALPTPSDVLLAIEVSVSTLRFDRDIKAPLYAKRGVAEFWIVDVRRRRVLVFDGAGEDGYARCRELTAADLLSPAALPSVRLTVDDIVG